MDYFRRIAQSPSAVYSQEEAALLPFLHLPCQLSFPAAPSAHEHRAQRAARARGWGALWHSGTEKPKEASEGCQWALGEVCLPFLAAPLGTTATGEL